MYRLNGRMYTASGALLQDALAAAHAKHLRPQCACKEPAAPMYIARSAGSFVVKRMPCTGHSHAPRCPHHSHESDGSIGDSTRPAIQRDPVTGQVRIRATFAMSSGETGLSLHAGRDHGLQEVRQRFTLRDLILYLWNEAELTTWRPEFAGKRTWGVVRHHLLRAASNVWVNGTPLAHGLFIPEPFSVDKADEIRTRRLECFANGFGARSSPLQRMLLIGEVKDIVSAPPWSHVVIKHLPDTSLLLRNVSDRWHPVRYLRRIGNPSVRLLMAATFSLSHVTRPIIEHFCLVPMSAKWLPVDFGPDHREAL